MHLTCEAGFVSDYTGTACVHVCCRPYPAGKSAVRRRRRRLCALSLADSAVSEVCLL